MTTPPPPPTDGESWPTRETDVVPSTEETVVAEPPPPDEPDRRIGWGMLIGILLVGLAAAAIAAGWFLTRDDDEQAATTTTTVQTTQPTTTAAAAAVTVPDVVGTPIAQARTQLDSLGFETQQTDVISDEQAGTVVDQSPDPGAKAARGATVTLGVAKGESTTTTGTTTATTTSATTTEATTTQSTTTGQTTTTTTTTTAPTTASVPDLEGAELSAAVHELSNAGLLASVQYIPGEEPLGTVRTQSPQAGQTARTRAHVTLNASSGPGDKEQKSVPDVTGQSLDEAVSSLNGAGLRLIFVKLPVTDRTQAGKVVEQTPAAGKTAPENAQVLVYLGAFHG